MAERERHPSQSTQARPRASASGGEHHAELPFLRGITRSTPPRDIAAAIRPHLPRHGPAIANWLQRTLGNQLTTQVMAHAGTRILLGHVKALVGDVQVVRAGLEISVAPGMQLFDGDLLVTGFDGRIGVTFTDNTRVAVGPNQRKAMSTLATSSKEAGKLVTNVDRGSLGIVSENISKSERDAMRVRTPTSMLGGVRG